MTTTTTPTGAMAILHKDFHDTENPSLTTDDVLDDDDRLFVLPSHVKSAKDMKIGIVGGGVAGLLSLRVLKSRGFTNLTLIEASSKIGGVWSNGYPNFGIQTPGSLYEFPDMPMTGPDDKDYRKGEGIQQYCEDYVTKHDLAQYLQLNTRVLSITKEQPTYDDWQWKLCLEMMNGSGVTADVTYDVCILATGLYSQDHKFVPELEGREYFSGQIVHSQDTARLTEARKGKKVVVVGFGCSAHDAARNALKESGVTPTLLYRQSHWCVPRKVLGVIPMQWLIYNRFGQGTLPRWQECGLVESIFQNLGLIWLYWRIVELLFTLQFGWYGSKAHLRPSLNIEDDMYCGHGVICNPEFVTWARKGTIDTQKGAIKKILPNGKLLLQNGTELEADEIVFATGFRRQLSFLPRELQEAHEEGGGIFAYRNMIVPGVPNICMINSNVTTFSNITTPGIQAAWLCELLEGQLVPQNVKEDVQADREWRYQHLTEARGDDKAIFVQLHQIRYWDRLLRDMGINVKRKSTSLANFFAPLCSSDYKSVVTGAYKNNKAEQYPKNYTPNWCYEWTVLFVVLAVVAGVIAVACKIPTWV